MALAGRSTRWGGGSRLLAAGIVVTLIVLLIDASIKSRSNDSVQRLSGQAWIDQVLPLVRDSTAEGQQLNAVRTDWQTLDGTGIASQLKQTAASAASTYKRAEKLIPPASYESAVGLLDTCFLLREEGSSEVSQATISTLSGPSPPAPSDSKALASAGQKLELGDQMYRLFTQSLSGLDVKMPSSAWVHDPSLYQPASVTLFLSALRNKTNLQPIHQVLIESFTTTPQPETVVQGVEMIPYSPTLTVGVVVANTGNQEEKNVTVTAQVQPAVKQPSLRKFLGPMQPGDPVSLSIGPLFPVRGQPITLTLTVAGASDLPASTKTVTLEMPTASGAPSSPTTTSPPPTTSPSTTAGGAAGGKPGG